jgi:hypothetical protein
MNFCGVDHSQILDDSSKLQGTSGVRFHCGTCVKTTSDDDVEISAAVDRLSIMESSDDDEECDEEELQRNMNGEARAEPVKAALDNIQQKLEETTSGENQVNVGISIVVGNVTPSNAGTYGNIETDTSPDHKWSPSPNMLNPLITSWSEQPDLTKNESSKLFCPVLDASPSLAKLMQRLQEGFHVRMTGGSSVGCLEGEDNVWLYLHDDRSRLCIETDSSENGEEKKNEVGFWIELPFQDVLRLEVGGNNRSPKGFSLVIEKESGRLAYYDFEASSAIDREIIVSAILLLLDQTHNPQDDQEENLEWRDGTLDQPIPCSPSLDRPSSFGGSMEQQPILCSPSLEQEHLRKSQLSPMNRTQIHNSDEARETETSLVTHFEDSAETNTVRSGSTWSRKDYPTMNFQFKNSDVEESRIDFKPSVSSTHPGLIAANSAHTTTGVWCPADVCTYALNDIAETCTGIFDLKRQDAVTPFGCDQQVIVEEFIASALGAPNAVYTYVTDGDIWNIQSSTSMTDAKETPVARNRASLLNAQAARLRSLRNEMTFAAALKQSKEKMYFVKTVQSFDDAYTRLGGSRRLKATTKAANQLHSSPLLRSIVERMTMHDPNGDFLEDKEENVVYYDSDPEDIRPRTSQIGPRRAVAEKVNGKIEAEGTHIRNLSGVGFDNIGSTKKISKKLDEETIVEIVHVSFCSEELQLIQQSQIQTNHFQIGNEP